MHTCRYAIEQIDERFFIVDSKCEGDDAYIGPYKWKVDAQLAIEVFEAEDAQTTV